MIKTRAMGSLLAGLCMAASAQQALAQARYDVTVESNQVVVRKSKDSGPATSGVTWILGTKGFRFGSNGVTVLGTDRTFSCPPAPSGTVVNCSIQGYDASKDYSFSVEVESTARSSSQPLPAPNQWIQND